MTEWSTPRSSPVAFRSERSRAGARLRGHESPLRRLDWLLLGSVLALAGVGTLLVWAATRPEQVSNGLDPNTFLKKNILNISIGLVLGVGAALIDYRALRAYAPFVYGAACLGLLAVLSPLGSTINGAHSWIVLAGGFQVEPSEFAKVGLVVMTAMILGEKRDGESTPRGGDVLLVLALAAVPMSMIMLQPDFGTTMVIVFVILGMLSVAGAPRRWIAGLLIAGALTGFGAVHFGLLKHYQVARLTSFANSAADPQGTGYNVHQAQIAIGSGGMTGKGVFQGTQTNGHFIPEQQTDFVFTVAGEELGFAGAGAIIVLLGVVMWRGLRIAGRAGDTFGRLVAVGVVCWFGFQSFENIGMTLGIMPVTGIPLPFVSYGGTAMFANMIAVGLLENVRIRSVA